MTGCVRKKDCISSKSGTVSLFHTSAPQGTSSAKEFYKKHHRWTEGFISAAKAVGFGANVLV